MSHVALWPRGWRWCTGKVCAPWTWGAGSWHWGSRFFGSQSVKGDCLLSLPDFGVGVGGSGGGMGTPTSACHAKGREMGSSDVAPLGAGTWVSQ